LEVLLIRLTLFFFFLLLKNLFKTFVRTTTVGAAKIRT